MSGTLSPPALRTAPSTTLSLASATATAGFVLDGRRTRKTMGRGNTSAAIISDQQRQLLVEPVTARRLLAAAAR